MALSADARILVVGAPGDIFNLAKKGYVRVYHTDKDDGSRIGQTIYGNASGDLFGWSVEITTEGNNIVLGAPGYSNNNDRPGYVRVHSLASNDEAGDDTWNQIGQDIVGEANGNQFGYSVSISEDGETIAVGAIYAPTTIRVTSGFTVWRTMVRAGDRSARILLAKHIMMDLVHQCPCRRMDQPLPSEHQVMMIMVICRVK